MGVRLLLPVAGEKAGTVEWQSFLFAISLMFGRQTVCEITNKDNDQSPKVMAGSRIEVNGSYYELDSDENISGWDAVSAESFTYIYCVPDISGGTCSFVYDSLPPELAIEKGGYYRGKNRALWKLYKEADSSYTSKSNVDNFYDITFM